VGDGGEPWGLPCGGGVRLHLLAQLGESRSAVNCSMSGTPEVSAKAIRSSRETSRWNEARDGQRRSVHRTRTTGASTSPIALGSSGSRRTTGESWEWTRSEEHTSELQSRFDLV